MHDENIILMSEGLWVFQQFFGNTEFQLDSFI